MNRQFSRLFLFLILVLLIGSPVRAHTAALTSAPSVALRASTSSSTTSSPTSNTVEPVGTVEPVNTVEPVRCGGAYEVGLDASINERTPDAVVGPSRLLKVSDEGRVDRWHSLFLWNLPADVHGDVTIYEATLELPIFSGVARDDSYQLARVWETWKEENVSWATRPDARSQDGRVRGTVDGRTVRIDVTTLVRAWATEPLVPFSVMLSPGTGGMDVSLHSRESDDGPPTLVIRCSAARRTLTLDRSRQDPAQAAALDRLGQLSRVAPYVLLDDGTLQAAVFDVPLPAASDDTPLDQARTFLRDQQDLLRLDNVDNALQFTRISSETDTVFFRQLHQGIPVYGSYVTVQLGGGRVSYVGGNYVPDIAADSTPLLGAVDVEALVLADASAQAQIVGDTQLHYFQPSMFGQDDDTTYLVWRVSLRDAQSGLRVLFLDADTGDLRFEEPQVAESFDLYLATANNLPLTGPKQFPCFNLGPLSTPWFNENGPVNNEADQEGYALYTYLKQIYYYWWFNFQHDSYNDLGGKIWAYVHVGDGWGNAQSNGSGGCLKFGDGWGINDIAGHEFTHSVDASFGNLTYTWEFGALDESFADIFGYFMDPGDWYVGEDVPNRDPLRNMANPPQYSDPDKYSDFVNTASDNGGVHTNSGIHNKAAYLIIAGDTHNGRTVEGIGIPKARRLFYEMLTAGVGPTTTLKAAASLAYGKVFKWVYFDGGRYGFTEHDLCQVLNAYAAVELFDVGDADCNGALDSVDNDDDGDGKADDGDNCPLISNTSQADADGDGLGDPCDDDDDNDTVADGDDNCPLDENPLQQDQDTDGIGDHCDDGDNDGVVDWWDNCDTLPNDQANMDGDQFGDACDLDKDGDGINDLPIGGGEPDNCPYVPNPDQANGDNDIYGDACDLCPNFHSDINTDNDNDGLGDPCDDDDDNDGKADDEDNCPFTYNPNQLDIDQNGIGFKCDKEEENKLTNVQADVLIGDELPFLLPVPICPQCGVEILPQGYQVLVTLGLDAASYAFIVDGAGRIIAQSNSDGQSVHELLFEPVAFSRAPEQAGAQAATQSDTAQSDTTWINTAQSDAASARYYLEIVPTEDPDGDRTYQLDLDVSQGVPPQLLYLPLLEQ